MMTYHIRIKTIIPYEEICVYMVSYIAVWRLLGYGGHKCIRIERGIGDEPVCGCIAFLEENFASGIEKVPSIMAESAFFP